MALFLILSFYLNINILVSQNIFEINCIHFVSLENSDLWHFIDLYIKVFCVHLSMRYVDILMFLLSTKCCFILKLNKNTGKKCCRIYFIQKQLYIYIIIFYLFFIIIIIFKCTPIYFFS